MVKRMFLIRRNYGLQLMIFNNAHEDCKKLTPEIVNTESGKYLHQFEWTDKISEIPDWYVFTEGHDTEETNWQDQVRIIIQEVSLGLRAWIPLR